MTRADHQSEGAKKYGHFPEMSDQVESEIRLRCCARPVWGVKKFGAFTRNLPLCWCGIRMPSTRREEPPAFPPAEKNKGSKCGINHAVTFSSERVLTRQCSPSERLATRGRKKTLKSRPSREAKRSRRCCLNPGERSILKYASPPPLSLAWTVGKHPISGRCDGMKMGKTGNVFADVFYLSVLKLMLLGLFFYLCFPI